MPSDTVIFIVHGNGTQFVCQLNYAHESPSCTLAYVLCVMLCIIQYSLSLHLHRQGWFGKKHSTSIPVETAKDARTNYCAVSLCIYYNVPQKKTSNYSHTLPVNYSYNDTLPHFCCTFPYLLHIKVFCDIISPALQQGKLCQSTVLCGCTTQLVEQVEKTFLQN